MTHLPSRKLRNITDGLYYLHSHNVVHEDLKGVRDCSKSRSTILTPGQSNILIGATGCAQITHQDTMRSPLGDRGNTARWTAPEILNDQGSYSKEADVFSFAMVMIEVRYASPSVSDFGLRINVGVYCCGSVRQ